MLSARPAIVLLVVAGLALVLGSVGPQGRLAAEAPAPVLVTNFPDVQEVSGAVTIAEPVPSSRFAKKSAVVSPAAPSEINDLTDGGVVEIDRFSTVTLGLAGIVQGSPSAGQVGALLIPDDPEILSAFRDYGRPQLPIRVQAEVETAIAVFSSEPVMARPLFPRYRVFFFNATPRTVDVTLYVGLSTS